VLRVLRVLRSYRTAARLGRDVPFFRRNQDVIFSILNLAVFLLVMTALVFETQIGRNEEITNYADALYFTVTTLTTTGFGDITLEGTHGRLLSVLIMIFGVSLFIRLAQTAFRPQKVHYDCPHCGLSRHDSDAVHCKHCGETLNIPTEGLT
jgi:voltage-gated potassium channel